MLATALTVAWTSAAAVPAPEQLLPADTLAVFAVPDWAKCEAARNDTPVMLLWRDPALAAFREKFMAKLTKDVITPLEGQLGIKFSDYSSLAQGQVTLAIIQNGWTGSSDPVPALLLIIDTRDKSDQLKKNLDEVKKKLADSGKTLKTDKIRDVEFATLVVDLAELGQGIHKAFPGVGPDGQKDGANGAGDKKEDSGKSGATIQLTFGQSGSLLVAGLSVKGSISAELEKVLARLGGGSVPSLAEQPDFEACSKSVFREAQSYAWLHFAPLADVFTKAAADSASKQGGNPAMSPGKVLSALGLNTIKTLSFGARQSPDGQSVDMFLGSPEDQRKGLVRFLTTEPKDASPPAFVPSDAVQFSRWRVDGQKAWATLESIFNEVSPGTMGFFLTQLETGLKQKDPSFDFKKNFIGNLGDDIIVYQKAPRGQSLAELSSAPQLFLIGSPNGDQIIQSFKTIISLAPFPPAPADREFLGRKIYSQPLPAMPNGAGGSTAERSLMFCASGGYVAMSTDSAILEEYLRSSDTKPKPLSETAGLADAAQRVGGMGTGLFGYQNDQENVKMVFEMVRNNADTFLKAFDALPFASKPGDDIGKTVKEWVDFALLPSYDKISKYFYLSVYAAKLGPEGYTLRVFTPTPPQLKH